MNKVISQLNKLTTENAKNKPLNTLSSLWIKIEKHQKRNANFTTKRTKLFDKFKQEAQPYEQNHANIIAEQVEHLISFLSKKSFTDIQRDELLSWITSDIDYLDSHPFANDIDTAKLREKINTELIKLSNTLEQTVDEDSIAELANMLDDMFDGEVEFDRETLIELLQNPALIQEHIERFHQKMNEEAFNEEKAQFDEDDEGDEDDEDDFNYQYDENFTQSHHKKEQNVLEKLFKGSQLNKMYKRLAAKLHPDKENDTVKKAIKHDLMQQLAKARENKDVFTLLTLYHEHIDDDSFNFDTETLEAIESLLSKKVAELNQELKELKSENSFEAIIWRKFNGRSNKITAENISTHTQNIAAELTEINQFIASTTTVKTLQKALNARINERQELSFFNFTML